MKKFRTLSVFGPGAALASLVDTIEARLTDGWSRNLEREIRLQRIYVVEVYWFECRSNAEHPEVALMMSLEGRCLSVADIFPRHDGQLTVGQYNAILVEFYFKFVERAAAECGLMVTLSSDESDPRQVSLAK